MNYNALKKSSVKKWLLVAVAFIVSFTCIYVSNSFAESAGITVSGEVTDKGYVQKIKINPAPLTPLEKYKNCINEARSRWGLFKCLTELRRDIREQRIKEQRQRLVHIIANRKKRPSYKSVIRSAYRVSRRSAARRALDIPEVSVLGTEITYGANGPAVEVGACYSIDRAADVHFNNQAALSVGDLNQVNFSDGSEVVMTATAGYPTLLDPRFVNQSIASTDPVNAMILVNGDNLNTVAALKGVQGAFGGQMPITDIISDYIKPDGEVFLPEGNALILYELGTTIPSSPAFDFQDLVLLLDVEGPVVQSQVIVQRDTIGNDSSLTDGMPGASTIINRDGPLIVASPGAQFTAQSDGTLNEAKFIIFVSDGNNFPVNDISFFETLHLTFNLWTDGVQNGIDSFTNNPRGDAINGHVIHVVNDALGGLNISSVEAFGHTGPADDQFRHTTFLVTVDLSGFNIPIQTGREYLYNIVQDFTAAPSNQIVSFRLIGSQVQNGTEDLWFDSNNPLNIPGFVQTQQGAIFQLFGTAISVESPLP